MARRFEGLGDGPRRLTPVESLYENCIGAVSDRTSLELRAKAWDDARKNVVQIQRAIQEDEGQGGVTHEVVTHVRRNKRGNEARDRISSAGRPSAPHYRG
jgi:hypothetical protein